MLLYLCAESLNSLSHSADICFQCSVDLCHTATLSLSVAINIYLHRALCLTLCNNIIVLNLMKQQVNLFSPTCTTVPEEPSCTGTLQAILIYQGISIFASWPTLAAACCANLLHVSTVKLCCCAPATYS